MLTPREDPAAVAWLERHPEVRYVDLLLYDTNGIFRGKRVPRADLPSVYRQGMYLPGSMLALDVLGGTPQATGLGFEDGDADRPCMPVPDTLEPVPWLGPAYAQLQVEMHEADGRPFFADGRHLLRAVLDRYASAGLTPVVAVELEFYLVDPVRDAEGMPQPVVWHSTGRRTVSTQMNGMTELAEHAPLLEAILAASAAQEVATGTLLTEYGPGQFEVNLRHLPDALAACDQAARFKRLVKAVAAAHRCEATFMAKPYADQAGSGLHLHVSVLDARGRNVFADERPLGNPELGHAAAGLLDSMAEGMALFAPNANSYRRFRPESYVPVNATWGANNRGVAVRVPVGPAVDRRLEHRVAGADANLYLVTAWVLAGVLAGLHARREPPPALVGNAYTQSHPPLPRTWAAALDRFESSAFAREVFGERFVQVYSVLKRAEMEAFQARVSPLECQWYLPAL